MDERDALAIKWLTYAIVELTKGQTTAAIREIGWALDELSGEELRD